jgi:hypothetical protein
MYKKLNNLLNLAILFVFIVGAYLTFSNQWIAKDINQMKMELGHSQGYYPTLTFCLLIVVPAVVLLLLKRLVKKKANEKLT